MNIIARIRTGFPEKFSVPRQSGLVETEGIIVFEPGYRNEDALRGIEQYSHLWLIWDFSENHREDWSPTVRPPKLGGNKRVGVFATRSPFRPNPIGLSSVRLKDVKKTEDGTVLVVSGADLIDNTPIYDIKPYLPYTDCHTDAKGGFAEEKLGVSEVIFDEEIKKDISEDKLLEICEILSLDPRPGYHDDEERVYNMTYDGRSVSFAVEDKKIRILKIV